MLQAELPVILLSRLGSKVWFQPLGKNKIARLVTPLRTPRRRARALLWRRPPFTRAENSALSMPGGGGGRRAGGFGLGGRGAGWGCVLALLCPGARFHSCRMWHLLRQLPPLLCPHRGQGGGGRSESLSSPLGGEDGCAWSREEGRGPLSPQRLPLLPGPPLLRIFLTHVIDSC